MAAAGAVSHDTEPGRKSAGFERGRRKNRVQRRRKGKARYGMCPARPDHLILPLGKEDAAWTCNHGNATARGSNVLSLNRLS